MPSERVVEIPWALGQLPHQGHILDVGSCDATYLLDIVQSDRQLHCLDSRNCSAELPPEVIFHHQSIFGNTLPRNHYEAVLMLSTLEHIGLPCYGQRAVLGGDELALAECWLLLRPRCPLIATVPVGQEKLTSWYRQYSPARLKQLFKGWDYEIRYWGFIGNSYVPIHEDRVELFDYRDRFDGTGGADAFAGIIAYRPFTVGSLER